MSNTRRFLENAFSEAGGCVPFSQFMEWALFAEPVGYYSSRIEDVGGERSDFTTAPELSDALGRGIAHWVKDSSDGEKITVIEVGGGTGALSATVLRSLPWWTRRKLDYRIVDISHPLLERQKKKLKRYSIQWFSSLKSALTGSRDRVLIFSNELVDAFPARWFRWNGENWEEVMVVYDPAKGIAEEFRPFAEGLEEFGSDWPVGQRMERHDSYHDWLREAVECLHGKSGEWLTIDYGDRTRERIYDKRPAGTMRGYFRNQRVQGGDVYARFGQQDLTCDVTFEDLQNWGESLGLQTASLSSQREYLESQGLQDDAMAASEAGLAFLALKQVFSFEVAQDD